MAGENDEVLARKRKSGAAGETKASKQQKTSDKSPVLMLPSTVVSYDCSPPTSAVVEVVSSKRQATASSGHHHAGPHHSSTTAVLPTLPTSDAQREIKNFVNETNRRVEITGKVAGVVQNGVSQHETDRRIVVEKCARRTIDATRSRSTAGVESSSRLYRSQKAQSSSSWRRLVLVGIIALLVDIYQSSVHRHSLFEGAGSSVYNSTATTMRQQNESTGITHLMPHQIFPVTSRHLLELDDYERQRAVLARTESELKRALADLADSRHDAVAARIEARNTDEVYKRTMFEFDQTNEELVDHKRRLELALDELTFARAELERKQLDLTMAVSDIESLKDQLEEACQDISDLYSLLRMQETVAANALNFVATTAIKQQQEAAAHAINFVTTLAMKQKSQECGTSG